MQAISLGLLCAGVIACCDAPTLTAQEHAAEDQDWRVRHLNECRLAHQILVHGQPANRRDWAYSKITGCGALGGEAVAAVIRRQKRATGLNDLLEQVVSVAANLVDRSILEAALEFAGDRTATPVARVQALRIVYQQLSPGALYPYEALVVDPFDLTRPIIFRATLSKAPPVGAALPIDAPERVLAVTSSILADAPPRSIVYNAAYQIAGQAEHKILRRSLCTGVSWDECERLLDEDMAARYGDGWVDDDDDDDEPWPE